ncbi:hypothetical protein QQX09_10150 [Demequina sp. SYSU T00192]|uniref:Uncharacterized protein n=1 Tax=Demequina litoralis TaxID=3051660 RepID=A0ABT8GAP7_9MICO|nr:hypothetical protein [Demequina sp. SYSU T00192]MDN4476215.1 hypothetical protein [Demequina sp. SYSU T00192]
MSEPDPRADGAGAGVPDEAAGSGVPAPPPPPADPNPNPNPTPALTDVPAAAPTDVPPPPPPRSRSRGLAVGLALSLIAVVALAVPLAMLASARSTWEGQNADLRAHVESLTDEVSAQNARIVELEQTEAQLETLKEEYSSAVNQGAQGTELVEELEDIADAYEKCVEAQDEHFDVLRNSELYVQSSIEESERSIVEFCAEVSDAYRDFREKHG